MKVVTIVVLLSIIFFSATFSLLYISFNLIDPENYLNQTLRKRVLQHRLLRQALRLEQVGDARYEYMHHTELPILIHLYYQDGVSLSERTTNQLLSQIQIITHKYVPGSFVGPTILHGIPDTVSDADIKHLRTTYAQPFSLWATAVHLNIFVLNYYAPHPSYAGLVEDDQSIFLFKSAIENVSETTETIPSMEISTILHEFAHLGGAEHIDEPNCILVDTVENLDFYNKISTIGDQYCEADRKEIQRALAL